MSRSAVTTIQCFVHSQSPIDTHPKFEWVRLVFFQAAQITAADVLAKLVALPVPPSTCSAQLAAAAAGAEVLTMYSAQGDGAPDTRQVLPMNAVLIDRNGPSLLRFPYQVSMVVVTPAPAASASAAAPPVRTEHAAAAPQNDLQDAAAPSTPSEAEHSPEPAASAPPLLSSVVSLGWKKAEAIETVRRVNVQRLENEALEKERRAWEHAVTREQARAAVEMAETARLLEVQRRREASRAELIDRARAVNCARELTVDNLRRDFAGRVTAERDRLQRLTPAAETKAAAMPRRQPSSSPVATLDASAVATAHAAVTAVDREKRQWHIDHETAYHQAFTDGLTKAKLLKSQHARDESVVNRVTFHKVH